MCSSGVEWRNLHQVQGFKSKTDRLGKVLIFFCWIVFKKANEICGCLISLLLLQWKPVLNISKQKRAIKEEKVRLISMIHLLKKKTAEIVYAENFLTCQGWHINDHSSITSISFFHVFYAKVGSSDHRCLV